MSNKKIDISAEELDKLETAGLSEQKIAEKLGCSRMGLYKYRLRIGCEQKVRSDKGKSQITTEDRRIKHNAYQRKYTANYMRLHGESRNRQRNNRVLRRITLDTLSRRLRQGEVIHHIDNDPYNNEHNNLVICTQSYHMNVLHGQR